MSIFPKSMLLAIFNISMMLNKILIRCFLVFLSLENLFWLKFWVGVTTRPHSLQTKICLCFQCFINFDNLNNFNTFKLDFTTSKNNVNNLGAMIRGWGTCGTFQSFHLTYHAHSMFIEIFQPKTYLDTYTYLYIGRAIEVHART